MFGVGINIGIAGAARRAALVRAPAPALDAYGDAIIADGSSAYWRLNETSGTTATDEVSSNDGTYVGTPTLGDAPLIQTGTSVLFDQDGDYISVPNSASIDGIQAIECWVKKSSLTNNDWSGLIGKDVTSTDRWLLAIPGTGNVGFLDFGIERFTSLITSNNRVDDGKIRHVVVQWTGSQTEMFVNGVKQTATSATNAFAEGSGANLILGAYEDSFAGTFVSLKDTIDEIAIYNSALTPTQIANHHALGVAVDAYGIEVLRDAPTSYWRLDETSGTTTIDTIARADGTYVGTPTLGVAPLIQTATAVDYTSGRTEVASGGDTLGSQGTVEFWFKPSWNFTDGGDHQFMDCPLDGSNFFRLQKFSDNQLYLGWVVGGSDQRFVLSSSTINWSANDIVHFVLTWDSATSEYNVYKDGQLIDTSTTSPTSTANLSGVTLTIGSETGGADDIQAVMDEIAIYDRVLTPTEVEEHYNVGTGQTALSFAQLSVLGLEDQWAINPVIADGSVGQALGFSEGLNNE